MEISLPEGAKFRLYRVYNGLDSDDEVIAEFIGYRVTRDETRKQWPGETWVCWESLYRTIEGGWWYFDCSEEEVGDLEVKIAYCAYLAFGKDMEELREDFRRENLDPELPDLLKPPPEIEEMHRETGYDA